MKPIAAPIVGGMITSTIHVLVLVPIFFSMMKGSSLQKDQPSSSSKAELDAGSEQIRTEMKGHPATQTSEAVR